MKKYLTSDNPHASLEPTKTLISDLDFKLGCLCRHLGIPQQKIADAFGLTKGAITLWKKSGIPNAREKQLCAFLGITDAELQIDDKAAFELAIQKRFSQNPGIHWRFFYLDHVRGGLDIEVIHKQPVESRAMLKALFKEPNPQHQRELKAMLRVSIDDKVRFRCPVYEEKLDDVLRKDYMPVQDLILIVEHPGGIQVLSMDEKSPDALIDDNHYYFPGKNSKPLSMGKPTGIHSAFLLFLAQPTPEEIMIIIQHRSGEAAADRLAEWLKTGEIPFKIKRVVFNVNS